MLRRHRRASPEGACLAFGKGDLDPFVWTVLRVLRQCRSFFATRDPEWQAFVEMTQVPFTAKTKVCGPAGVLKRYLQVMSLSVEVDGTIVFRNQARLHLLRCCYAELRNAVCEAWDDTVLARLRQRSGAEDLESLDSSATRYVLDQMPDPSYRQAAVMHLAGGFPARIHLTHSDGGNDKCTTCGGLYSAVGNSLIFPISFALLPKFDAGKPGSETGINLKAAMQLKYMGSKSWLAPHVDRLLEYHLATRRPALKVPLSPSQTCTAAT